MSAHREPDTVTPWFRRSKTLLISAGALAAALLGIVNLWDRVLPAPDPDVASIESVIITKQTSLGDFAQHSVGKDLLLSPAPKAAVHEPSTDTENLARIQVLAVRSTSPPQTPMRQTHPTPTPAPASQTSRPGTPTPALSSTLSGTSTPMNGTSMAGTPTAKTSMTPTKIKIPKPLGADYLASVEEQEALSGFADGVLKFIPRLLPPETVDVDGKPIPPAEVAKELARALEEVDAIHSTTGVDPIGWTLAVRLNLEGLAHEPLLLTWSLDGVDVSQNWQAENLAYRIVATTAHDAGVAEIWVPDLKRAGAYNVNVRLTYESDGTTADLDHLELPNG